MLAQSARGVGVEKLLTTTEAKWAEVSPSDGAKVHWHFSTLFLGSHV